MSRTLPGPLRRRNGLRGHGSEPKLLALHKSNNHVRSEGIYSGQYIFRGQCIQRRPRGGLC